MKTKLLALITITMAALSANGQKGLETIRTDDSLLMKHWLLISKQKKLNPVEALEFVQSHLKDKEMVHKVSYPSNPPSIMQSCTNMDFETGNLSGWTTSTGYNPQYNPIGCCPYTGGAQIITNGTALDPCGGFPVVCPGGNFSLKLGDNQVGGIADRIEQSFVVTPSNAYFTYKYAVVLQDPGHNPIDQPKFVIEMLDQNGSQIPCTYYAVTAGQNIPGFQNSTTCSGVIFKPWSSVSVDLTNYIGQTVTIRFTTYDCGLGGHYGYAYIDGSCLSFPQTQPDTICVGQSKTLCAPSGFLSYLWSGTGVNGNTNQCVTVNNPGNYVVQTIMYTGCPGPTFNYPLYNRPTPNANFNIGNSNTSCGLTVYFHNTSSNAGGNTYWYWNFGDGNTSTLQNPIHTYSSPGQYSVTLIVGNSYGCYDTTGMLIDVNNSIVADFQYHNACVGASISFTNTSYVNPGNINQSQWNFGNGQTSNQTNPVYTYTAAGSYSVTLIATSNKGCKDTVTKVVNVYPLPTVSFTANNVCDGTPITFSSHVSVSNGSISSYQWNFGNGQISSQTNPSYQYPAPGTYSVTLYAISNYNCANSYSSIITVYPLPNTNFSASHVCYGTAVSFTNQSSISSGSIVSYQWQFGDGSVSYQNNPVHCYEHSGIYSVTLKAISDSGCIGSFYLPNVIEIYPVPIAGFITHPDRIMDEMEPLEVQNSSIGATQISYTLSDGTTFHIPDFTYNITKENMTQLIIYQSVTNQYGCKDSNLKIIEIVPGFAIYFPNAFTPNGDDLNDGFTGKGYGISEFKLYVYDRWGHLIYETDDIQKPWNGKDKHNNELVPNDTYVWKAIVKDKRSKSHEFVGHVTVVR